MYEHMRLSDGLPACELLAAVRGRRAGQGAGPLTLREVAEFYATPLDQLTLTQQAAADEFWERRGGIPDAVCAWCSRCRPLDDLERINPRTASRACRDVDDCSRACQAAENARHAGEPWPPGNGDPAGITGVVL